MSLNDVPPAAELRPVRTVPVAAPTVLDGRRRPGRFEQVNPHLVPLLRNPASAEIPVLPPSIAGARSSNEDLTIARGFGIGLLLAVPTWAAIGLVTWAVLR